MKDIAINESDVIVPTFDHAKKDPTPNGTVITSNHKVVIVEGLYLFLEHEPWKSHVKPIFDEKWLIDCDWNVCENRIVKRHVASGICKNEQEALHRWLDNDKPNGIFLREKLNWDELNVIIKCDNEGIRISNLCWDVY